MMDTSQPAVPEVRRTHPCLISWPLYPSWEVCVNAQPGVSLVDEPGPMRDGGTSTQ